MSTSTENKTNKSNRRYPNVHITNLDHLLCNSSKGYFASDDETKPVNFQLPYPLHDPVSYDGPDIVFNLLKEKKEFLKKKDRAKPYVKLSKAELSKSKLENALLPMTILDVYKSGDPDFYFDSDYNFYYTGGCLEYLDYGENSYLILPKVNNELNIFNLQTRDDLQIEYKPASPVLSIKAMDCNNSIRSTVREKNKITVLEIDVSSGASEIKFERESARIPFVDSKLNSFDNVHLALISADFYLKLYDIETNKSLNCFSKNVCNYGKDCFVQIEFIDTKSLMLANRRELKILDAQTGNIESEFQPELDGCNTICCFQVLNNTAFVATRHDLLRYDIRNTKEPYEYFSHMLNSPPCYMDILEAYEDTFITLSGQKVDQKVLFGCKSINKLPAKIPSVLDTFKACRLRKDVLLKGDVEKFLMYATTGIKFVEKENRKIFYSSNCIGQIFQQSISEDNFTMYEPIEHLYGWINKLPKPSDELYVTGIVEMSDVHSKVMKNINFENPNRRPSQCKEFLKKFSSIYTPDNFCNMTGELMSIWEIEDDSIIEEDIPQDSIQPHSKVAGWLDSNMFDENEL